jgi:hypothetical protein
VTLARRKAKLLARVVLPDSLSDAVRKRKRDAYA